LSIEPSSKVEAEIAELIARSTGAWNRGDLDAFMACYDNSARTMYIGADTVVRGHATIRAQYAARFTAQNMGTLEVSELEVRSLGNGYALAVARWQLSRPPTGGSNASGRFTLVLQRGSSGWSIIADHSP
jgi:uncharacterized protein (TIGR02246 family)